jgi:hypothetical protein
MLYVITNNISAMMYNMAFSFIGVQRHFQHCDKLTNLHVYRYIVGFFLLFPISEMQLTVGPVGPRGQNYRFAYDF